LASAKGLPLRWPELDLDELILLRPDELWLGLQQPLQTMAERYSASLVLGGYVDFDVELSLWIGRWQLIGADMPMNKTVSGETIHEVVAPAIGWIQESLSAQYAIAAGGDVQEFLLQIHDIDSLPAQAQVSRYLLQLPGAQGVHLEQVRGSTAVFRVFTRASMPQWLAWVALQARLVPTHSDVMNAESMEFRWHG
jgi:hypothetical protein